MALRDVQAVVTITTNATKAIDDGKKLRETYKATLDIIKQFRTEGKIDTPEGKELLKLADDLQAKIKTLVTGMELIEGKANELAANTGKDVNRVLREINKELNKTERSTDEGRLKFEKLQNFLVQFKEEQSIRRGLTMPLEEAKKQLTDLINVSPEKLRQGLAAINKELDKTTDNVDRANLDRMKQQYQAQLAVTENRAISNAGLTAIGKDKARLQEVQQQLMAGYKATAGVQGYEYYSNEYLNRLHQVNQSLQEITETERKEAQEARRVADEKERAAKTADMMTRLNANQKVSIQELTEAQKIYEQQLKQMQGTNLSQQDQQQMQQTEQDLQRIKQALTDISQIDVRKTIDSLSDPNATTNLEQMEAALKKLKENASQIDFKDNDAFRQYTEDVEKLEKVIDETKAKMQGIADIDFDNLENVSTEKLEAALKRLEEQEKKLAGTQGREAQEVARKKALIQRQLEQNRLAVMNVERAEKMAANTGKHSVNELKQAYEALQQKLVSLKTSEQTEIKKTRQQMEQLKKTINDTTESFKKQSNAIATTAKNLATYMLGFAGFNKIKSMVESVFQANLKLSDSLADIRKVSGLSSEAINQLYRNITQIDTRNTIEMLNQLAYTGAKLGIGQNHGVSGLTGFVKAAEQVQMALGEDMGEKALPELAKMTEVMGLIDKYGVEQSMQKAASAIFQLGATSTATGTNIVEFSKRLYGLANVSRISTQDLLALGSASDAMGLMPEVAATAFNKLFTAVQKNHNMIEKTLGLQDGMIKDFYSKGQTMEAIVKIFEKMNETGNLNLLGNVFKDLGSDGARLVNVMATMSDRVDILQKHLNTSRAAFKEGEAVIGEYMIQNQTAAAMLERASNLWAKAFTNPEGVDMVKQMAQAWYDLSKRMTESEGTMWSLRTSLEAIALVIKTIIALSPYLIRFGIIMASAFGVKAAIMGITTLSTAIVGLIRDVRMATGVVGTFNTMLKSNVFLGIASTIATVATVLWDFANAAEEAQKREAEHQAELKKAFDGSKEAVQNAVKPLETYKKALDEANLSEEQKMALVRDFKNEYQDYLDYLGLEVKTVDDLRDAYARVVEVMKIKKAYEEREDYRTQLNGQNRMERIGAQSKVESAARTFGVEGIDKEFLEKNADKDAAKLYREIVEQKMGVTSSSQSGEDIKFMYVDGKLVNAGTQHAPRAKVRFKTVGSEELYDAIEEYLNSFRTERDLNIEVDRMFDTEFTWTDADGKERKLSEFDVDEYNQKVQEARWKRKGTLENEAPDKAALAAAKKADQEAKEALRKDLQDAKKESDAVISKIEEWYRLQETVITDMAADGKLTQEQAEQVIRTLNIAKNTALRDARLAISGRDTQAWEQTKQQIGNLMLDQGKWSQELLQQILDVSMESIRRNLANIDKGGGKYGITTTSLKDAVDKNAAGNQREIARLQNRSAQEVEKLLEKYQFVEVAVQSFSNRLAQMGILTETARHMAERLADANDIDTLYSMEDYNKQLTVNEKAKRETLTAFVRQGTKPYAVNPEDINALREWFMQFVGEFQQREGTSPLGPDVPNVEYVYQSWAEPFKEDYEMWLRDSDKYKSNIQAFYFSLLQSEEEYFDARKKAYNKQKKDLEQMWEVSGQGEMFGNVQKQLDLRQRELALTGRDKGQQNMLMNAGFINLGEDPEIAQSILRMEQAQRELEMLRQVNAQKKLEGDELLAHNQLLHEKELALADAQMAMQEQLMKSINDRISKLQEWTAPIENFGTEVGKALYDQWHNGESMTAKWQDMLKSLALSWGQLTVKITSELMMQKIKQQLINKAMQVEAASHQATMATIEQTGGQARQVVQQTTGQALVQGQQAVNTTLEVQEQAHNATMLSEDVGQAAAENPVNISRAAGKTLANLGWWGIPLVAVVTALLNMLLQAALGSSSKKSEAATKATDTAAKTKLVSGMLTYDRGNTDSVLGGSPAKKKRPYLGNDGRVYLAEESPSPKDGLVTRPIATTVQGQPALVAERGPEIVIGRKTTRAIMLNEPELIRYIANYDRHGGKYGLQALRAYDQGTAPAPVHSPAVLGGTASGSPAENAPVPDASPAGNESDLRQFLSQLIPLMQRMSYQLDNPVAPEIAMYDSGGKKGLHTKMKEANKFMAQYSR